MSEQPSGRVDIAIVQLRLALAHLDGADEHVSAALVADVLSRLGCDVERMDDGHPVDADPTALGDTARTSSGVAAQ